jgi:small subunit ribosomal protein S21
VSEIRIGDHDNFEVALKKFNRKVQQDGILAEARRRRFFEKPSEGRKRQAAAKVRKLAKLKKKHRD